MVCALEGRNGKKGCVTIEKLLTIKEVSALLRAEGKKNKLVYEIAKKGLIPSAKIGNRILFKETDVIEYVDKMFRLQNK